ncbi:MAG: type II toxin-antitoxin system VapC family toxin [Acidobacteriota bacterium]|nr:type II toxin-antitoxin system VapC family toxin [Acidobacteriota bacterium]
MIVDSSALVALVFREPAHERVIDAAVAADWLGIGAPTLAETGIVLAARIGEAAGPALALLLEHLDLRVVPFEALHARVAREAFRRYGRGRHSAELNFGDCLTYAVAKVARLPLLFVGDDFAQTDLEPGLRPAPTPRPSEPDV